MVDKYEPYIPRLLHVWPADAQHQALPGTMVFVDISGFTAMSERLARFGKLGAEEVVGVLNNTFSALIITAAGYGGDLLKFGGDALLLWFTGDDHLTRGATAGAAMRNELRVVGKQTTAAGRVALKMTVGVHTGDFDFFVVGGSHRELIIAGPAATRTVATEESADAGQVLVSPAVAAGLPTRHVGEAKGEGHVLKGNPVAPEIALTPTTGRDLGQHVPLGLRNAVGGDAGIGEHRTSTIAFVKYTGIDRLLADEGPDKLAERFDGLVRLAQAACYQYEVTFLATDVDKDGGKIILTAGVPVASDADDERMLLAVRHIVESDPPIKVKIGVNRGRIFAADVGAPFRRTYTIIGDDVNLAARVMTQAGYNEVLATLPVLDSSRTKFATTPIEPFMVKGKTEPVVAASVGEATGTDSTGADLQLPLFGHADELKTLLDGVDSVPQGKGVGFLITGPPGIGKSRLLDEVIARTPELPWLTITCERYHQTTPYFAAARLLRRLLGVTDDANDQDTTTALSQAITTHAPDLKAVAPLIGTVLDLSLPATAETRTIDTKFISDRTQDATVELMVRLTPPTGIMVNNGELMDGLSIGVFDRLLARVGRLPIMLVNVRRPDETGWTSEALAPLELAPIDDDDAGRLVNALRQSEPLSAHVVDQIVERASGNPLFLIELALASGADGAELPDSVEATVSARIDRVPPDLRKLLRYGAAVGRAFDPAMLAEALGDDVPSVHDPSSWRALDQFLEKERGTNRVRFRQKIYRHVAYAGLPFRTRRILHDRIGRVIETQAGQDANDEAEILSMHFDLAGDGARAWRYSLVAADDARAKSANAEAAEFYRRARRWAAGAGMDSGETAAVAEKEGDACEVAALFDEAAEAYAAARRFTREDVLADTRLIHKRGILNERLGRYSQALRWYTRGLAQLERSKESEARRIEVELKVAYAGIRHRQGNYRDCVRWCNEAIDRADGLDLKGEVAHALYLLAHALRFIDKEAPVAEYDQRALNIYEEIGDFVGQGNVLNNLGLEAYMNGRWDAALEFQERHRTARTKAGDIVGAATADFNVGLILLDQGKLDEAQTAFEDVQRVCKAANYQVGVAVATANLGIVATRKGELDKADASLQEALRLYEELGADYFIHDTRLRLAELALKSGDPVSALRTATEAIGPAAKAHATVSAQIGLQRVMGLARLQLGEVDAARTDLATALDRARTEKEDYEAVLAMNALRHLSEESVDLRGGPEDDAVIQIPHDLEDLLAAELNRLGIIGLPEIGPLADRPALVD